MTQSPLRAPQTSDGPPGGHDAESRNLRYERWLRRGVIAAMVAVAGMGAASMVLSAEIAARHPNLSVGRAAAVLLVMGAGLLAILYRRPGEVTSFFVAVGSPKNLAVFRVTLFALLLTSEQVGQARLYSTVPSDLIVPPLGWGRLLPILPINSTFAGLATAVFMVSTTMAMIGLFTRSTALLTFFSGLYVLGVPQFFGKVNHYHHLLWFVLLIAVSSAGDEWSVDALRTRGRSAQAREEARHVAYELPLRFVMLLMGIIYFFPGFWKFVLSGPEWALSDNVKYQMYAKWAQLDGWTPIIRIDEMPMLYRASGVFTLAFELFFILLILTKSGRRLAFAAGLLFHASVMIFMNINFVALLGLYVVFVDWDALFDRGRKVGDLADARASPPRVSGNGSTRVVGVPASRVRIRLDKSVRAVVAVGIVLVIANTMMGVMRATQAWPFASYPTFAQTAGPTAASVSLEIESADGSVQTLTRSDYGAVLPSERLQGLLNTILDDDPETQRRRLGALIVLLGRRGIDVGDARYVTMYRDTVSVVPEDLHSDPIEREVILKMNV